MAEGGARLAIRLLQDAAVRGELDPWDVDVIAVVDGFLDQLRQRIEVPRLVAVAGGSYEQDLAETSEAFLAASVLVGLKAEVLEAATFPPEPIQDESFGFDFDDDGQGWLMNPGLEMPRRPERHLWRRPVAPPPLQRPVTLGELIRQLEDIAERIENDEGKIRSRHRPKRYSERAAIEQVAALAHREKLPETTAALSQFLLQWSQAVEWAGFEELVEAWAASVEAKGAAAELDADRVGVFWALLFLCHQGKVDLEQTGGLFGPLSLKRLLDADESVQLALRPALVPALEPFAA
ncbi:MAG: segregation/condensation protein A [Cyanobium sp. LacPavin_0920_WC12_MAG_62_9]|nr:segregation/condensation protein A [Cyanobium sp. LacPavin_0920_WC12_MAG_62_9]